MTIAICKPFTTGITNGIHFHGWINEISHISNLNILSHMVLIEFQGKNVDDEDYKSFKRIWCSLIKTICCNKLYFVDILVSKKTPIGFKKLISLSSHRIKTFLSRIVKFTYLNGCLSYMNMLSTQKIRYITSFAEILPLSLTHLCILFSLIFLQHHVTLQLQIDLDTLLRSSSIVPSHIFTLLEA